MAATAPTPTTFDDLNAPAGCGCTTVGVGSGGPLGGLALGLGLLVTWIARRRRVD